MVADSGNHEARNGHGRCAATTLSGGNCRGFPIRGSGLCFAHHPETQGACQAGRARGGKVSALRLRRRTLADLPLRTLAELGEAARRTSHALDRGEVSEERARTQATLFKLIAEVGLAAAEEAKT